MSISLTDPEPAPGIRIFSICTHHCIQNAKKHRIWCLDRLIPTTIACLPSDLSHPLIVFITLRCFSFWLAATASLHGMLCAMPPWACRACLAVRHWRWSDHRLRVYRVQIWASLSLNDSTLINILQKSSIFTLEKIWNFLLSSSSWCLRRSPSSQHLLLHLEHSSI